MHQLEGPFLRVLVLLTLCLTPFVVWLPHDDAVELPKRLIGGILITAATAVLFIGGRKILFAKGTALLFAVALIWATLTTALSPWPLLSIFGADYDYRGLLAFFQCIGIVLLGSAIGTIPQSRRWFCVSLVLGAVLSSVYALSALWFLDLIDWRLDSESGTLALRSRAFGLLANPSFLGMYLAMACPLAVHFACSTERNLRWIGLISIPILVAGTVASQSRIAIAAILLGSIVYAARVRPRRFVAVACTIGVIGILTASFSPGGVWTRFTKISSERGSGNVRLELLRATVDVAYARPLVGYGVGTTSVALRQDQKSKLDATQRRNPSTHNFVLDAYLEMGIPGVLIVILVVAAFVKAFALTRRTETERIALWAGVASGALCLLTGYASFVPMLVLALMLGTAIPSTEYEVSPQIAVPKWLPFALVLPAAVSSGMLFTAQTLHYAAIAPWSERLLLRRVTHGPNNPQANQAVLVEGLRYVTWSPEIWVLRAKFAEQLGSSVEVVEALLRAQELDPTDAEIKVVLGAALRKNGNLEQAKAVLLSAIHLSPNLAEAHFNLGNVYWQLARHELAANCYKAALKIRPDWELPKLALKKLSGSDGRQ